MMLIQIKKYKKQICKKCASFLNICTYINKSKNFLICRVFRNKKVKIKVCTFESFFFLLLIKDSAN